MSNSLERFLQLRHALEDGKTTFEIGDVGDHRRQSCMVCNYGDCNLIYGLDIWSDEKLPHPSWLEHPELIAIGDDDGKNIAIVEDSVFRSNADNFELDVEVAPYLIENQIAAINKRLSSAIVEPYRDSIDLDTFNKECVLRDAEYLARIAEVNGTPIINYYDDIVDETDYYCIRNGSLKEEDVARRYCEKNKYSLVTDKIAEELLEQGVLDETQAALAKMLRELGENVKAITLVFEKDGARASAKIAPYILKNSLEDKSALPPYQFKNDKECDAVKELFGNHIYPTVYDIESVTYGNKTLYARDDGKAVTKEKKHADIYER